MPLLSSPARSWSRRAPAGRPKTADSMNAELANGGVYDKLQQKQVTAWLGIRNAAGHGNYGDYAGTDVVSLSQESSNSSSTTLRDKMIGDKVPQSRRVGAS